MCHIWIFVSDDFIVSIFWLNKNLCLFSYGSQKDITEFSLDDTSSIITDLRLRF